jgi:hypothetical protein
MHFHRKPKWTLSEREATPEPIFRQCRKFLAGGLGVDDGGPLPYHSARLRQPSVPAWIKKSLGTGLEHPTSVPRALYKS